MVRSTENKVEDAEADLFSKQVDQLNFDTTKSLMPMWCRHIAENLPLCQHSLSLDTLDVTSRAEDCIVIGASPSLTDDDLLKLRAFEGEIIVTNKSFKRLVDLSIVPEWVVLLDGHPVSASQFRWMSEGFWKTPVHYRSENIEDEITIPEWVKTKTKFFISATAYPATVKILFEQGCPTYMFNPMQAADEREPFRTSQMWGYMNGLPEFAHGGNCGTCSFLLAQRFMYKRIGVLGLDFCEEPNPDWTQAEAMQREYLYYPESPTMKMVAIPVHFKAFLTYFIKAVQDTPAAVRYLGKSPLLRYSPYIVSESIEEFLEGK